MATQQMQMPQTSTGAATLRRTGVIVAVVAALAAGVLIGRATVVSTRSGSVPAVAVRPAIALTGTDSADAVRRAEVYQAMAGLDAGIALTGTNAADAVRRAEVFRALAKLGQPVTSRLSDAENQARIARQG